jgi:hypothetical protein
MIAMRRQRKRSGEGRRHATPRPRAVIHRAAPDARHFVESARRGE